MVAIGKIIVRQMLLNLRTRTVYQHQMHAQTGEQIKVMGKLDKLAICHHFAAESDNKRLPPKCIDVRRNRTEPGNELGGIMGKIL